MQSKGVVIVMKIPLIWIRNRELLDDVLILLKEIAKQEKVDVIEVKSSEDKEIYISNEGKTCSPNKHYAVFMLENPAIYFTEMDSLNGINSDDVLVIEKAEDLSSLREELIERVRIAKAYSRLPKIDCGKCGRKTCYEFAVDLVRNKADLKECVTLVSEKKLVLKVNGKIIFLNPWLQDLIRNTIMTLIGSLKGVEIKGDEKLSVEVKQK